MFIANCYFANLLDSDLYMHTTIYKRPNEIHLQFVRWCYILWREEGRHYKGLKQWKCVLFCKLKYLHICICDSLKAVQLLNNALLVGRVLNQRQDYYCVHMHTINCALLMPNYFLRTFNNAQNEDDIKWLL